MPRLHGIKVPGEDEVFIIQIPDSAIDNSPPPAQALLLKMDLRIAVLEAEVERLRTVKNGRIADLTAEVERLQERYIKDEAMLRECWSLNDEHRAEVERLRGICDDVRNMCIDLASVGPIERGHAFATFWPEMNEALRSARETP